MVISSTQFVIFYARTNERWFSQFTVKHQNSSNSPTSMYIRAPCVCLNLVYPRADARKEGSAPRVFFHARWLGARESFLSIDTTYPIIYPSLDCLNNLNRKKTLLTWTRCLPPQRPRPHRQRSLDEPRQWWHLLPDSRWETDDRICSCATRCWWITVDGVLYKILNYYTCFSNYCHFAVQNTPV